MTAQYGYDDYEAEDIEYYQAFDDAGQPEVFDDPAWDEAYFYGITPPQHEEPGIDFNLSNPGPGCIALVTLVVSLILAMILIKVAAGIDVDALIEAPAVSQETAAEIATLQAAAENNPQIAINSPTANTPCLVSNLFPEKVRRWCGIITYYADQHQLNPDLVAALVWLESGGDEVAYSRSGAVGLMQVMPRDGPAASFQCINGPCFSDRPTIVELQNPEFNVAYGTQMLAGLIRRRGDLREALRSYGPMNVGYSYADQVLGLFEKHRTPTP